MHVIYKKILKKNLIYQIDIDILYKNPNIKILENYVLSHHMGTGFQLEKHTKNMENMISH